MLGRIEKADIAAMMFLQKKVRRPYLDFVFRWVTRLGNGAAIWIILSHVLYFYISHRAGLTVLCNIFIMDSISNFLIKPFVRRKRPWEKLPEITVLIHKPKDSSFPSGHSACAVSSAFMVGHFVDPLPFTLIYLLALLISFSRSYVGVHYPSDVIGGMLLGAACSVVSYQILFFLL